MTTQTPKLSKLAEDLDSLWAVYKKLPVRRRLRLRPEIQQALTRLAAVDPGFAFEVLAADYCLRATCFNEISHVVASLGDTRQAVEAVGRVSRLLCSPARILSEIAAAAGEGTTVAEFALDELLTIAAGIDDEIHLARFFYSNGWRIGRVSVSHVRRLIEMVTPAVQRIEIDDYRSFYTVRDFIDELEPGDLAPGVYDELKKKVDSSRQYWETEGELLGLRPRIERIEGCLAAAPDSEEELLEKLDDLVGKTVTVIDDESGEPEEVPALDGHRLCIGDGDDEAEFRGGFWDFNDAFSFLMPDIDAEDIYINWSDCPIENSVSFGEFADDVGACQGSLEDYLEDNDLAEIDREPWGGDAPGRSGSWVRVWIHKDMVIPILWDLWKGHSFAAKSALPVLTARREALEARQKSLRTAATGDVSLPPSRNANVMKGEKPE